MLAGERRVTVFWSCQDVTTMYIKAALTGLDYEGKENMKVQVVFYEVLDRTGQQLRTDRYNQDTLYTCMKLSKKINKTKHGLYFINNFNQ